MLSLPKLRLDGLLGIGLGFGDRLFLRLRFLFRRTDFFWSFRLTLLAALCALDLLAFGCRLLQDALDCTLLFGFVLVDLR